MPRWPTTGTIAAVADGWLDLRGGASGDMLLGALVDAGVPTKLISTAVAAVSVEPVLRVEAVRRHGLAATRVQVDVPASTYRRTLPDVVDLLDAAALDPAIRSGAVAVFTRLATAEALIHDALIDDVHFHEVGALDAIADVVGVLAGFHHLGLERLSASEVSVGSGSTHGTHAVVPVPAPAVLALLQNAPVSAGPVPHESCTPTGAALLAHLVEAWEPLPSIRVLRVGHGAGERDPSQYPNLVRLVLGDRVDSSASSRDVLLQANIDDFDLRLWPHVLRRLLDVGADDAWLVPILMKKGRSAHTLSVLCTKRVAATVQQSVFAETSTIGLRMSEVDKVALKRTTGAVEIEGARIATKTAWLNGQVVNVSVEHDDVTAAASRVGLPAKEILRAAEAAAYVERPA